MYIQKGETIYATRCFCHRDRYLCAVAFKPVLPRGFPLAFHPVLLVNFVPIFAHCTKTRSKTNGYEKYQLETGLFACKVSIVSTFYQLILFVM